VKITLTESVAAGEYELVPVAPVDPPSTLPPDPPVEDPPEEPDPPVEDPPIAVPPEEQDDPEDPTDDWAPPPDTGESKYPRPKMIQGEGIWTVPDAHYGPWQPGPTHFPAFEYLGKFGFPRKDTISGTDGTVRFNRGGFSVGGKTPDGRDIIWMTTHQNRGRGYMAFAVPEPGGTAEQLSPYFRTFGGEGKQFVTFDVFYDDGRVIVTAGNWYDAAKQHRDYLFTHDIDLTTWKRSNFKGWCNVPGGFKTCGYLSKTPDFLRELVGPYYFTGASNMSIITQYSPGSSLTGWNGNIPDDGGTLDRINPLFQYDLNTQWGEHQNGRYTWPDETMTPNKPWSMISNRLTPRMRGWFTDTHFIQVGTAAGSRYGIWYGHNGRYKGNHTGHPDELGDEENPAKHKSHSPKDDVAVYWMTPLYDRGRGALDAAELGDAQPSEWGYLDSVLPGPKFWGLKGSFYDYKSRKLYLLQGQNDPEIFVYRVK